MSNQVSAELRILIVDDHPVVRAGLTSMLSTIANFTVVGAAASGQEALDILRTESLDVVLMDLRMPAMNGTELLKAMKRQGCSAHSIVLTSYETDEDIYRAIEAGAMGYLLKDTPAGELIQAIQSVHAGRRVIPARIAGRLAERMMRSSLTEREREVLEMLAKGLTNRQIGQVLGISVNTARNHVNSILSKLEVADRTEAVSRAIHHGLIDVTG